MMTQITGKLTYADGAPVFGTAVISWPPYMLYGMSIAGGMKELVIEDGIISVALYPVGPSSPQGVYYTVRFELEHGPVYEEFWIVPDTVSATIEQIRVNFPLEPSMYISPAQMTGMGAQPGMILSWNGANWTGGWVTMTNVDPSYIRFEVGTEGTDFNIEGSPAHLGGTAIFNVPSASQTARGVVTTGDQVFAGNKTFTGSIVVSGTISGPTIDALDNRLDVLETTPAAVQSVFGRFGVVVAKQDDYSVGMVTGAVPNSLMILTDNTLSGGGDLTQNRTLSVVPEKTVQKVRVSSAGVPIGAQPELGFTSSGTVSVNVTDDAPNNRVNIAIDASSVGLLPDPTIARGDLIVRNITSVDRLPVGVDGEVLVVDSVATLGVRWAPPPDTGIPTTRRIIAGPGLAGGGDLSADVTLSAPDDVTVQKIRFARAGTFVAARHEINFVPGANITLTVSDTDEITNRVDVGISATPGAGGFPSTYQVNGSLIGIRSTLNLIAGTNITLIGTDNTTVPGSERIDITVNGTAAGVPLTRQVIAGTGLTGGGALSADVTLSVVPKSTVQKLDISTNDGATAAQPALNFLAGTGITISQANNVALSRVDVTINAAGAPQTPWTGDHDAAGFTLSHLGRLEAHVAPDRVLIVDHNGAGEIGMVALNDALNASQPLTLQASKFVFNVGSVGIGVDIPAYKLDVAGDVNITGTYRVNGVPLSTSSGSQTPWTSNIDAAGFGLNGVRDITLAGFSGVNHAGLNYKVNGFTRWQIGIHSDAPNFDIIRLNSAGTFVDIPLRIKAADGDLEVAGNLYINNSGGTAANTFRLDGYVDTFYMVAQGTVAKIGMMTGDQPRLMVHPSGYVGIGTGSTTPEHLVTVDGGSIMVRSGNYVMWRPTDNSWHMAIQSVGNALQVFSGGGGAAIASFHHGGRVGIGVTTPHSLLSLVSAANPANAAARMQFCIGETGNNPDYSLQIGYYADTRWNGVIQTWFGGSGSHLLLNPNGGQVLVNMTGNSAYTFEVNGSIGCTQNFYGTLVGSITGNAATATNVAWGGVTGRPNLVQQGVYNNGMYSVAGSGGLSTSNGAFEVREANHMNAGGNASEGIPAYAPRIGFHWAWIANSSIYLGENGNFRFVNGDHTAYQSIVCANCEAATFNSLAIAPDGIAPGINQILRTSSNNYVYTAWINTISGANGSTVPIARVYASDDAFIRYYSPADFKTAMGLISTPYGGEFQANALRSFGPIYAADSIDIVKPSGGVVGFATGQGRTGTSGGDYGGLFWRHSDRALSIYHSGIGDMIWIKADGIYMNITTQSGATGKLFRTGNQLYIS